MSVTRRAMLTEAGEVLLVSTSAMSVMVRDGDFSEQTGIAADAIMSNPLCAIPLPIYSRIPEGQRRWSGVRPEAMWHPLMWLPDRLAFRYDISVEGDDSAPFLESDDLWAIRMALELSTSGLYDAESGEWVDILATINLNVENPADLSRVQAWLDGAPDEDLDAIDLSNYLDLPDREWALSSAIALLPELQPASWALMANDLLAVLDDALDPDESQDLDTIRAVSSVVLSLSSIILAETNTPEGHQSIPDFARFMRDQVEGWERTDRDEFITHLLQPIRERLYWVRESYWGYLARVDALVENDSTQE